MSEMPIWGPDLSSASQMRAFINFVNEKHQLQINTYQDLHAWSIQEIASFWQDVADFFDLNFDSNPTAWFESAPKMWEAKWLVGAKLNYAQNILRHDEDRDAIVSYLESGEKSSISFKALRQQVAACAAFLRHQGIGVGDKIAAISCNQIEAIVAMLACATIGAVWANCSPDFGDVALVERFAQIEPKLLFAVFAHQYNGKRYEHAEKIALLIKEIPSIKNVVWFDKIVNTSVNNHLWTDFVDKDEALVFESLSYDHPLFILFSSGTTGKPKCIVHRAGGVLLEHIKDLGLHTNLTEKDRLLFYSTTGWMMWNWMLSALALGTTLVLYEGSIAYPNMSRLLEIVADSHTTVFGASAAYFASLEKNNVTVNSRKLQAVKSVLSTGSTLLPAQYDYIQALFGRLIQISSVSGGTDIVSCFAIGNPMMPVYKGELQCIGLGLDVKIFDEAGHAVQGKKGELVCCKPFPTIPLGFLNDTPEQARFIDAYFRKIPGVWAHGDYAELTNHHGLIIYGRSDATLNPQGVRFGTSELYLVVNNIPGVMESIAVSQAWAKDTRVILFVVLKPHLELTDELRNKINLQIKTKLSPRHVPAKILQVRGIPKTLNGKLMETAVGKLIQGQVLENLSVITNPECLEDYWNRKELQLD
jgi:acetoacetyl-CoA synthetase